MSYALALLNCNPYAISLRVNIVSSHTIDINTKYNQKRSMIYLHPSH